MSIKGDTMFKTREPSFSVKKTHLVDAVADMGADVEHEVAGLAARDPEVRLAIIGPGVEVDELRRTGAPPGVTLTGGIPPDEIANYYHAIDVGVLPFAVMPFTDNAMPLKVIEYGFAKKPALATPLKELTRIGLPHVRFAPRERAAWEQGLAELLRTRWEPEWEPTLRDYRWTNLAARLLAGIGL